MRLLCGQQGLTKKLSHRRLAASAGFGDLLVCILNELQFILSKSSKVFIDEVGINQMAVGIVAQFHDLIKHPFRPFSLWK